MRVTINIDGGSRGNPGPGASAYVIKDANGKILAQEGHFIAHCTNNQAEYTALKLALIKARSWGPKSWILFRIPCFWSNNIWRI